MSRSEAVACLIAGMTLASCGSRTSIGELLASEAGPSADAAPDGVSDA